MSKSEDGACQYQGPSRGKKCTIFKLSLHKEKVVLQNLFCLNIWISSNACKFEKEGNAYQYQDPSRSKSARCFQTEQLRIKDGAPQILSIEIAVGLESRKDSAYSAISRSLTK